MPVSFNKTTIHKSVDLDPIEEEPSEPIPEPIPEPSPEPEEVVAPEHGIQKFSGDKYTTLNYVGALVTCAGILMMFW